MSSDHPYYIIEIIKFAHDTTYTTHVYTDIRHYTLHKIETTSFQDTYIQIDR